MSEVVENWKLNRLSSSSEPSENAVEEESSSSTICVLGETESRRERIDVPATMELEIEGVPVKFEVDTGACDSVISKKTYQEKLSHVTLRRTAKCFQSVSGQDIRPEGELAVKVRNRSGDLVSLQLFVLQAERNKCITPLLGRSSLDVLVPEWRNMVSFNLSSISTIQSSLKSEIQAKFPYLFGGGFNQVIEGFTADIVLKQDAVPIFHKPYTIPFKFRENVDLELDRMVQSGILVPVRTSTWASPIVVTPKKDGSIRICLDGKATLNRFISTEHYQLPSIDDVLASLANFKVFCKIDLTGAYLQVKLSDAAQDLCTINTHRGLFKYTRMPFGISSAPSLFQSIIDQILLDTVAVPYLDDILIGGRTLEECKKNLFQVLDKLNQHRVQINWSKSVFFETEVEHLGFRLTSDGIRPSPSKVEAICLAPAPKDVSQLQSFLGLLNYYHRFLPNLSSELRPLYDLLRKDHEFVWSSACQEAFVNCKKLLVANDVLEPYDPSKPLILTTDASPYGIGAVLSHQVGQIEKPVCFASSTLTPAQVNYGQIHKEALAVMFGVSKFHKYLYGTEFTLVTDSSALKQIFNPHKGSSAVAISRLHRWAVSLSNYSYRVVHRPGKSIGNADALSRLPLPVENRIEHMSVAEHNLQTYVGIEEIKVQQQRDSILSKVIRFVRKGWPRVVETELKPFAQICTNFEIEDDCLYFEDRVVIPKALQRRVLEKLHENHDGVVRMKMIGRSYFWWKGFDKDVADFVKSCVTCQKTQRVPREVVESNWPPANHAFERLHLDLFHFEGQTFLIVVDAYSKFIDVKLLRRTDANSVLEKLDEIYTYFGLPTEVCSDNGPPFNSSLFVEACKANNINVLKSPPYHPQSNGLAERGVQTIKTVLKKYLLDEKFKPIPIQRKLNRILFNYRNTPSTTTGRTPSSMMFSYVPRTLLNVSNPIKLDIQNQQKNVVKPSLTPAKSNSPPVCPKTYSRGDKVFYRNHMDDSVRWIPAIVLEKISPHTYLINLNGNVRMVHTNQIRVSDLSDKYHPSLPVISPIPESEQPTIGVEVPGPSSVVRPTTSNKKKSPKKKKSENKRKRSESTSPKLRRSKRIRNRTLKR
ncbi:uncharacterized protein K02A2.6-like [Aedes albopictus]|uniref:RNA-directed DNA polymerase n=1 Tax=Aedes albopictus TaxID=7160 RepID=A0ABM1Z5M4_AEDAL